MQIVRECKTYNNPSVLVVGLQIIMRIFNHAIISLQVISGVLY